MLVQYIYLKTFGFRLVQQAQITSTFAVSCGWCTGAVHRAHNLWVSHRLLPVQQA
jgi:hypothetical protein